jgi:hypothetical protein
LAGQPITQEKARFLKQHEDEIMDMVSAGSFLDDIAETIDPTREHRIERTILSRFLTGKLRVKGGEGAETEEEARARGRRYQLVRMEWGESIVEQQAKKLFDEINDKMANLRKNQAEFAMKLAGIHNEKYREQKAQGPQINIGELHLQALRMVQRPALEPSPDEIVIEEPETFIEQHLRALKGEG